MIEEWMGAKDMAAYRALQPRMAALGATCVYLSKPPAWFAKVVKAAAATPVVVNVKGMDPDTTPVLVTLAELERLHQAAGLASPTPADLDQVGGGSAGGGVPGEPVRVVVKSSGLGGGASVPE